MKSLIIAEKPSVARNIADAVGTTTRKDGYLEGNDYIITWVFGHILQLYDAVDYNEDMKSWRLEKFPFIPQDFKYKIKEDRIKKTVDKGAKKQVELIEKLANRQDVDKIISATDWDREGQIIGDELLLHIDTNKEIKRLLLNEWTKEEVLGGLSNLKENEDMKPLREAGFGRQIADWLIGINLTSVATVKHYNSGRKNLLNVGRVLMPTLKIIYDKDMEIANFVQSKYYKLVAKFQQEKEQIPFESTFAKKSLDKLEENFEDKKILEEYIENIDKKVFVILEKEVEQKKENPPLLFNLSNLQGFITGKYKGFTADKVLKIAQELYEKKLITYPRTASSVLDESLIEKTKKVFESHKKGKSYESRLKFKTTKRIFDSKKVESHSAIIPTYLIAKNLSRDEQLVYDAILNRFMAQFMPIAISEETKLIIGENKEDEFVFITRGKVQIDEGFRVVEGIQSRDNEIPNVREDEKLELVEKSINELKKRPPKYHTEKTLLKVMETCGKNIAEEENQAESDEMMMSILSGFSIGTPATRAETIKKLKDVGYIIQDKKNLKTTELGKMMVESFPVRELFDLEYTGRLEKTLSDIEKGKFSQDEFLDKIKKFTEKAVEDIKKDIGFPRDIKVEDDSKIVGICPNCQNKVVDNENNYGCVNWKNGCKFTIWKNDKYIESLGKQVTKDMVEILLKNGKVGFRRLKSKKGNYFSGYLKYEKDENDRYSWNIEFIGDGK